MKKVTLLLVVITAMVFSTAFAKTAQAVGAGKMKLSASVGYTMYSPKDGDSTQIFDIMGKGLTFSPGMSMVGPGGNGFTFLDSQVSGLSFAYGINDEMHVALSLPVFNMTTGADPKLKQLFGAAQLGFVFSKAMGAIDLTANAYVVSPFAEMYMDDRTEDGNFDQPLGFGLALAIDSPEVSKLIWGFWMNLSMYLEKTKTISGFDMKYGKAMLVNFVGIVGYKIDPKMSVKLHVYYDTPNLQNDEENAPGFADAQVSFKGVFDMKLAPNMGISAGLWYRMGLSDEAGLKDVTNLGLSVGYNMTF
jgi:hypothetical protein